MVWPTFEPNAAFTSARSAHVEPLETIKLTADPAAALEPAAGLWLITTPGSTIMFDCWVTTPMLKLAPEIVLVATACESPRTFGTITDAGPVLTVIFTAEPADTFVPALGLWLITLPEATVELLAELTVPTVIPAPVIALVAAACVSPTTLGTVTMAVKVAVQLLFALMTTVPVAHSVPFGPLHPLNADPGLGVAATLALWPAV